jgi:nitrogen fixation protein FixH
LTVLVPACSPGQDSPPSDTATGTARPAQGSSEGFALDFRSDPDPLRSGNNTIEVTLRQRDGAPVTDATVTAVFSMPAMPAMNMPAMRSEANLAHVDGGLYRGTGQLSMAGTWNVAVTATRQGEPVGRRNFSIVAK